MNGRPNGNPVVTRVACLHMEREIARSLLDVRVDPIKNHDSIDSTCSFPSGSILKPGSGTHSARDWEFELRSSRQFLESHVSMESTDCEVDNRGNS
jgi:hypothetical protein